MSRDSAAPIDNPSCFILELILALRRRGMIIPPAEAAQAAKLIDGQKLGTAELADALRPMLVRKPADDSVFAAEYAQLVRKRTETAEQPESGKGTGSGKIDRPERQEPPKRSASPYHIAWTRFKAQLLSFIAQLIELFERIK